MQEKLRSFGLTRYESDVYLTLLRIGTGDANLIATTSGVPSGRIYSILSSLQEKKIIHSQETRPRKFAAVDPGTALKYLLENQRFKLQQASLNISDLAVELERELQGIKPSPQTNLFWTAALGFEETHNIIIEQINQVNNEMSLTVGYPEMINYLPCRSGEKNETKDALLRALERGVKFRMLIESSIRHPDEHDDETTKNILKHFGKNLECRKTAFASTLFDVIDDDKINLKISSPINKDELFAIVHVRDRNLAVKMKDHFNNLWESAEAIEL